MVKVYNKATGKVYGEIITNHGLTIDEAMLLVGLEMTTENLADENDLSYYDNDGDEFWYDDIDTETI